MLRIDAQRFPLMTVITTFTLRNDDEAASPLNRRALILTDIHGLPQHR